MLTLMTVRQGFRMTGMQREQLSSSEKTFQPYGTTKSWPVMNRCSRGIHPSIMPSSHFGGAVWSLYWRAGTDGTAIMRPLEVIHRPPVVEGALQFHPCPRTTSAFRVR